MTDMQNVESVLKVGQGLLAATCLTAAAAVPAGATTFTATSAFSTDKNNPTVLPAGTTAVNGLGEELNQYFELEGLTPGTINFSFIPLGGFEGSFLIFDSANTSSPLFANLGVEGVPISNSVVVGSDGNLTIGYDSEDYTSNYSFATDATTSSAPEPGTSALAGVALAGALAWRRRRSKQ